MNKTVAILKRVIIDDKPRYCTTIATSNGKIRADTVMFKGQEIRYPGGCYYLSFYEGEKQIRVAVGKEVSGALIARDRKRSELDAKNNGVEIVETKTGSPSLAYAIEQYLEDIKGTKKPKTLAAYRTALNYFTESCHKVNIADIERRDLLRFVSYLRDEKDQSPRFTTNLRLSSPSSRKMASGASSRKTIGRNTLRKRRRFMKTKNWRNYLPPAMMRSGCGISSSLPRECVNRK